MRVIFLQDVRNVARRHDVRDVADGYARNFLFPNKLAEPATATALKKLEALKSEIGKNEKEFAERVEKIVGELKEKSLEFFLKTDAKGSVFGSINKDAVLQALRDSGLVTKERVEIKLERPIKELGEHKMPLRFKNGAEAELKIIVRPQE